MQIFLTLETRTKITKRFYQTRLAQSAIDATIFKIFFHRAECKSEHRNQAWIEDINFHRAILLLILTLDCWGAFGLWLNFALSSPGASQSVEIAVRPIGYKKHCHFFRKILNLEEKYPTKGL
jgi:hypothetical protein